MTFHDKSGRIPLPPECASRDELWTWIERWTPLIEAMNANADEVAPIALDLGLTASEAEVFRLLHARLGEVVSSGTIIDALYALRPGNPPEVKIVDVYVCKLRRKLCGSAFDIQTAWGMGYRLRIVS